MEFVQETVRDAGVWSRRCNFTAGSASDRVQEQGNESILPCRRKSLLRERRGALVTRLQPHASGTRGSAGEAQPGPSNALGLCQGAAGKDRAARMLPAGAAASWEMGRAL